MAVSHPKNDSRTVSYTIHPGMSSGNRKKSPKILRNRENFPVYQNLWAFKILISQLSV